MPHDHVDQIIRNSYFAGKPMEGTSIESIVRSLYGSKKIIGHIDLRPGDLISAEEVDNSFEKKYVTSNFDDTLYALKEKLESIADRQDRREKIMVTRFEEELGKILAAHPELKDKPEIKFLRQ